MHSVHNPGIGDDGDSDGDADGGDDSGEDNDDGDADGRWWWWQRPNWSLDWGVGA